MTTINLRELYPWYTEDMLHFRSLMNDYHLKDLSGKIKSVLHAKMRSGQYIAAYAPYGYRKSAEDRHRLVIDEEAAAVVRRMFELRCGALPCDIPPVPARPYLFFRNGYGFFRAAIAMGGFRMAFSLFFSCFSRKLRTNVPTFSFEFFVNLLHFWKYRLQFSVRCCIMKCSIYGL